MADGIRIAVDSIPVRQTPSPTATTSKRIPTLDGLRAVSIILVLLNHLVGRFITRRSSARWDRLGTSEGAYSS